jgi:hypothetical protein
MAAQSSRRKLTGTFTATGEDRKSYVVHVYTWYVLSPLPDGGTDLVESRREFVTATGLGLSRLSRGRYLIGATGVVIQCADPAAP